MSVIFDQNFTQKYLVSSDAISLDILLLQNNSKSNK